jgi:hypothetical protein
MTRNRRSRASTQVREVALALIETTLDIGKLADIIMANFLTSVADSASYAAETNLRRRLERAIAALESELAKATAAPPPA